MTEFIVDKENSLERFVRARSFGMGFGRYAGYIKQNKIKLNGKKANLTDKVYIGDVVKLFFELYSPPLDIVYNDGQLLVIDKPQGLPSVGEYYYTAENIVAKQFPNAKLCHRLDTGTGGLLMFALTDEVYEYILTQQKRQGFNKFYRAVVTGNIKNNDLTFLTHHLIKRGLESRVRVYDKSVQGSQECRLVYRAVKKISSLTLLDIQLFTGRTHQIRAQLDHCGLPIVGDDKYGDRVINKHYKVFRPLLQAYKLDFSETKGDYTFCGKVITLEEADFIKKFI